MSLRDKTRRRLFLLLLATFGIMAIAGTGAGVRLFYLRRTALRGRSDGLASFAQGDYPSALTQLGTYLSRNPNDAEVLLPYAEARELVEEPNGANLGQAIALYQRVLELSPGLAEAQRRLLDLDIKVGFYTETIDRADQIVLNTPGNSSESIAVKAHALLYKAKAQIRLRQFDKPEKNNAQTTVAALTALTPLDLDARILELQVKLEMKESANDVIKDENQLALAHPNDDRFVLLESIAATLTADSKNAASLAKSLVTHPLVDSAYTRLLVQQLDNVGDFEDSFSVMLQAAKNNPDPDIQRLWFRRLFETSQYSLLVDQTAGLDPAARDADVEALALRAMALSKMDRPADAKTIVAALEMRGQKVSAAKKWAVALHATALHESPGPVDAAKVLRDVLSTGTANPILLQALGDAYADAGSHDKAMSAWREAAYYAPEWSEPLVRISQTLIAEGRPLEAQAAAKAAISRAPHDHDALISQAVASAATLPDGPSPAADDVLAQIADIQKQFPNDADLLPLQVGVLARTHQRDAALKIISTALAADVAPSERVLLALARASQSFGLGQEDACWTASEKAHGLTADLALARAISLLNQKRGSEGLALLQQARAAHPENDLVWKRIWAEYLDISGDARAIDEWKALAEGNPNDVNLQWGAIAAHSVQADYKFVGETIGRLISLLGNDDLDLKLLRARWLLTGPAGNGDSNVMDAAKLLGDIIRSDSDVLAPRLLLADCYARLGNTSGEVEQLEAASNAHPDLAGPSIELAGLLNEQGDYARSRHYIDQASRSNQLTILIAQEAAGLLGLQGDYEAAVSLLEKAHANEKQPPADLLLAKLYQRLGQPDKTAEIYKRLLEKPEVKSIAFAADFYATQGRMDDAQFTLTGLDALKLAPGVKESVLADYAAKHGTTDDALKYSHAAAEAAPQQPDAWRQLVTLCFGAGKIDEALAAASEASAKLKDPAGFKDIKENAALLTDASNIAGIQPLFLSLGSDHTTNAPILDAIRDLVAFAQQKEPIAQTIGQLRQLADHNPHLLALQMIALDFYIKDGQNDEAIRMATRTAQSFPSAVEPRKMEASLLGSTQQWDEALSAAEAWRRVDASAPLDADLAIAKVEVQLGDVSDADQQIARYLDQAKLDPDKFLGVILLHVRGLLANQQPEEAQNFISQPMLANSAGVRSVWVSLAVHSVDDPQRAAAWLNRVADVTPAANPTENTALANAWIMIGNRFGNADDQQKGKTQLKNLLQTVDPATFTLLSWGSVCEDTADLAGAQLAYEQVLQRDPKKVDPRDRAVAMNNLASVLVKRNANLDEALQMAKNAVSLYPNAPTFLDTLASVQAARRDYSEAIANLRQAQKLDPKNFEWRVNLLAIMIESGQGDAKAEVQQITSLMPTFPKPTDQMQKKFELLKANL